MRQRREEAWSHTWRCGWGLLVTWGLGLQHVGRSQPRHQGSAPSLVSVFQGGFRERGVNVFSQTKYLQRCLVVCSPKSRKQQDRLCV